MVETKYICSICGYEYEGEDFTSESDDYVCPLCEHGKEAFPERSITHEVNLATNQYHEIINEDKEEEKK